MSREGKPEPDGTAAGDRCPRCEGSLRFWLKLHPIHQDEGTHRVYQCEACSHFEWVFEAPGKRT